MKPSTRQQSIKRNPFFIKEKFVLTILMPVVALLAGFCTMSCEIVWTRILKYFVDNSIQAFSMILATFLTGLALGGYVFSRFVDSRKAPLLFLGFLETGIGLLCLLSILAIGHAGALIAALNTVFGKGFNAEIGIRVLVFSSAILPPTMLMGGVFPLVSKLYAKNADVAGRSVGEIYAVNTVGAVVGSFAGGFVLIPLFGVQNSISCIAFINVLIGMSCVAFASALRNKIKIIVAGCLVIAAGLLFAFTPRNAFLHVYDARTKEPDYQMLYLKENVNGTVAVFKETRQSGRKYMLIDGIGEVSTDYFSMRAFRMLGLLPALYSPGAKNALVVTFGSGIAAGTIANLPGIEKVECIEICKEAFNAANSFAVENHDVLHNPKVRYVVNDGRNFLFTTRKRYDLISADASHPTSSDSWILYTKEFYELCRSRLSDSGVMCQWIPLRGVLEKDYKTILNTFRSVFPYMTLWYAGGYKAIGHTILCGSKRPMKIDMGRAGALLDDSRVKSDLEQVNVFSLQDVFNCFVMDQDSATVFGSGAALNTDDRPVVIFSKAELWKKPFIGLRSMMRYRMNIYPELCGMDSVKGVQIKQAVDKNFEAMGHSIQGQILEFEEFVMRMDFDPRLPDAALAPNLSRSRDMLKQVLTEYTTALEQNTDDAHTRYLMIQDYSEYRAIMAYLDRVQKRRQGR
ncbi:MAG TPA: fused MFS/spermidine synthase [Chitinivibrionales bacterium]|nr:fused MFS/spermidine synthase [Chitinivibrionales bacterium]